MPEGHTIHRLARDHTRHFVGQCLTISSPQGRFRRGAQQINGRLLTGIDAHGKHLFYLWEGDFCLHVHLGLYGKFRLHRLPAPEPRGAVRVRAIGDERAFDLNGPAACDVLTPKECNKILARLGQDPLREDADPSIARARILKSRAAIGRLLLDQSVIAGVGNIFRAESLFVCGLHPEREGRTLSDGDFDALWSTLTTMLRTGVRYNRIITTDPRVVGKPPSRMNGSERLHIYGKARCPDCNAPVRSWDLGARTVYACDQCQR